MVWVDVDDLGPSLSNTAVGRANQGICGENPRVSRNVLDPQDQYRWLSVSGSAELTTDGADPQIDKSG